MIEHQRGQTLPLTLAGVIAMLIFAFFGINYANTLRWQVRAQNAADAAAQAILTLQTQQFNEMTATLYAAAVEEYRIRHLLNAMVLAAHGNGGCNNGAVASKLPGGCNYILISQLEPAYYAAVGRYSGDVLALHQVTASLSFTNVKTDALALMAKIGDCTSSLGDSGNCAFKYGTPVIGTRADTESVFMDASGVIKPTPGNQTPLASTVSSPGSPPLNTALFAPLQVEVYACATVPSLVPSFFGLTFPPFTAVARGAATPVMVEEDWLQPGTIYNPYAVPQAPYQPPENFLNNAVIKDASGYDWYNLDYGGNGVVAVAGQHFINSVLRDEFSVYIGWWNSIPIHPFSGHKSTAAMGCST